jgi:hypothetical protein
MSSKFFSSRNDNKRDGKFDTKNAPSARTNNKRNNSGIKKSGRGK